MDCPNDFSSVTQKALVHPSPPIAEKLYMIFSCKFVDDDGDDDGDDDDDDEEEEEEEEEENTNRKIWQPQLKGGEQPNGI